MTYQAVYGNTFLYTYVVVTWSLTYATLFQIKLLCVSTSIGPQAPTLSFVAPSKGAAVLVEHEASAELDNVDDDYVWRGRRTYGPLLHSHTIHANEALNHVISTTWQTNRVLRQSVAAAPLPCDSRCQWRCRSCFKIAQWLTDGHSLKGEGPDCRKVFA